MALESQNKNDGKGSNNTPPAKSSTPPSAEELRASALAEARKLLEEEGLTVIQTTNTSATSNTGGISESALERILTTVTNTMAGIATNGKEELTDDQVAAQYHEEDLLTEPILFMRAGSGGWSHTDFGVQKPDGTRHVPPFRSKSNTPVPIKFERGAQVHDGYNHKGEAQVVQFLHFICKNKKEAEYLRNHPDFGVVMYESTIPEQFNRSGYIPAVMNAQKIASSMTPFDRISSVRARGIDVAEKSPDEVYILLVNAIVKDEMRGNTTIKQKVEDLYSALGETPDKNTTGGLTSQLANVNGMNAHAIHKAL